MGATHTATCKWCNKKYEKGNNALIFIKLGSDFCSKKCETAFNNSQGGNNSNGRGSSNEGARSKTDAEITYEIERKRKQDQLRDEQERKSEARKEQKILKYQEEGKKFLLFTVEKPILTFFIFFLILPIIFLFGGAILFGGGRHVFVIALIPMIVFAFFYLKETFKK